MRDRFLSQVKQSGRRLGRPDLLFWTLPYLMILITVGTVAQKYMGLHDAQMMYFSSFYFWLGPLPLPAGYSVLAFMTLNLACKFIFLSEWTISKAGIHIIHLSVLILLAGGLLTAVTMREGFIPLKQGQSTNRIMAFMNAPQASSEAMKNLPFSITLNHFRREVYPATDMPKDYESRVTIRDGDIVWPAVISMNEPLRYGGYTVYQSATMIDADGEPVSVLSIVTNKGWVFPYISGILLAFGLVYHTIWRVRHR